MKRCIAILLTVLLLLTALPAIPALAADAEPLYIVDMIDQGLVSGHIQDGIYRRSGCQREYASTGQPSGTPEGAVWLGETDGSTYREFLNGFRFHSQNYVTNYTFTMPEGYNTFSGTTGVCWHIDSTTAGYNNKTVVSVLVNGARVWSSGPIQIQTGYDFTVNAPEGATVSVTVDSVDGNTGYGHVCFGDPVLTFDPDYIPTVISLSSASARMGQPITMQVDTGDKVLELDYAWWVDGLAVGGNSDTYIPTYNDLEKMVSCTVTNRETGEVLGSESAFCSKLPVLYIETNDGTDVSSKDTYEGGYMTLSGSDDFPDVQYDGIMEIKGRGNATWGMPKKSYHVKLDKKTDLLGMGESKHWVLMANYQDECFLRNKLSYDLGIAMGLCGTSSEWVDVIFNGKCVGNYLLCEQVRIGETRVNITEWEEIAEDIAKAVHKAFPDTVDRDGLEDALAGNLGWVTTGTFTYNGTEYTVSDYYTAPLPDITGGYLLEMDRYNDEPSSFWTSHGLLIKVSKPEYTATNTEMLSYISAYTQALEDACYAEDFYTTYNGESLHYSDLADVDSMIRWFLVQEVFFNWDAGYNSNYLYKDVDGKMVFGPVWDMDLTAGGYLDSWRYDQWQIWYYQRDGIQNIWFKELMSDPYFLTKTHELYWKYRPLFQQMVDSMDTYYEYLKESGAKNTELWRNQRGFEQDFQTMKTWFTNHMNWLDAQFATADTFMDSISRYNDSSQVAITATYIDGAPLEADTTEHIAADHRVKDGKGVKLEISAPGNVAKLYLNGKLHSLLPVTDGKATLELSGAELIPEIGNQAVINVIADGRQNYTTLALEPAVQTGIAVAALPEKTDYAWGEPLDLTGLRVQTDWSDGVMLDTTAYTVTGYNAEQAGEQILTVQSGNFTATFKVTVAEPKMIGVTVVAGAEQYPAGYVFTAGDLTVTAIYEDGREEPVSNFDWSAEVMDDAWVIRVTVGEVTGGCEIPLQPDEPERLMGDVDMSGVVDVADIMKLKALIMADKWSNEELAVGDMDGSRALDVGDIMAVKNIIMAS